MLIAYILPDDQDIEGLETNQSWRLIFGLPILTYSLMFLGLVLLVPYDSPKFHMQLNQRSLAIKSIHKVYNTDGDTRTAHKIYNYIKKTSADTTSKVSFTDAFFINEKYTRASWISVLIIVFSELTGF